MIQNDKHSANNVALENINENTKTVNNMKDGWNQAVNNVVHYYKTPFNIALVLVI